MDTPTRDEALTHFGKKGMKWGVTTASPTTSKSARTPRRPMTTQQKQIAFIAATTGAAITAAILAGPSGSMAVSGLSQIVNAVANKGPAHKPTHNR